MPEIKEKDGGILFYVKVQPRAAAYALAGTHGDAVKVKLRDPPVDEAANRALIRFLADLFRVKKSDIEIVSGHHTRKKRVLVRGASRRDLESLLEGVNPTRRERP